MWTMERKDVYLSDLLENYSHVPAEDIRTIIEQSELKHPVNKEAPYPVRWLQYYKQYLDIEERLIEYDGNQT